MTTPTPNITNDDLLHSVAAIAGLPVAHVKRALDAYAQTASKCLSLGADVPLLGLGKLAVVTSAPRRGRNPKTGEEIDIPARRRAKLKPGKALRDSLEQHS